MVDISSGDKKINITVSTSGNKVSVNATPDTAMYYSNKSREWAISDRIVDGVDYSSKYYAGEANKSALNAQSSAINVSNTYSEFLVTASKTLEELSTTYDIALENINSAEETSIANINTVKDDSLTEMEIFKTTAVNIVNTTKDNAIIEINNTGINTKANTALNNLTNEGKEKFDSPWVSCNEYQIFSNVGLSSSTYSEFTLDFLPDNGLFELNCLYMCNPGTNNGYARLNLNDESENYRFIVGANTGTAQNTFMYGQVTLIVSNKKIKAMKVAGGNGNEKFSLTAIAYRKLGTGFETISESEET